MKISKKVKIIVGAMGVIAMVSAANVSTKASNWYYGAEGDCSISDSNNFKRCTSIKDTKGTTNATFHVKTLNKTMRSTPSFKLVNSDGATRSVTIDLPKAGYEGSGSLAGVSPSEAIGHYYYAGLKAAWNQIGTDTVTAKISAD